MASGGHRAGQHLGIRPSGEDANPMNRRLPAECIIRRRTKVTSVVEEKLVEEVEIDLKVVLGLRPENRIKWLTKALKMAEEGRASRTELYDIISSRKFASGVHPKVCRKFRVAVHDSLDLFSDKQRRFLTSEDWAVEAVIVTGEKAADEGEDDCQGLSMADQAVEMALMGNTRRREERTDYGQENREIQSPTAAPVEVKDKERDADEKRRKVERAERVERAVRERDSNAAAESVAAEAAAVAKVAAVSAPTPPRPAAQRAAEAFRAAAELKPAKPVVKPVQPLKPVTVEANVGVWTVAADESARNRAQALDRDRKHAKDKERQKRSGRDVVAQEKQASAAADEKNRQVLESAVDDSLMLLERLGGPPVMSRGSSRSRGDKRRKEKDKENEVRARSRSRRRRKAGRSGSRSVEKRAPSRSKSRRNRLPRNNFEEALRQRMAERERAVDSARIPVVDPGHAQRYVALDRE